MKKHVLISYSTLLTALLSPLSLAETVHFYNWGGYIDEEVLAEFEQKSGHRIQQDYFETEAIRDEVINSGRSAGFDVIIMDSWSLHIMADKGLFHNVAALNEELGDTFFPQTAKACGNFGVPYAWGTMGLLYRASVSDTPINSWKQLFSPPPEHQGSVVMYTDVIDGTASALLALEYSPWTSDIGQLKEAYSLLLAQKPDVIEYAYSDSYALRTLTDSKMTLGLGYAGDEYSMAESTEQEDWQYVVPKEGTVIWVECLAFPTTTQLQDYALDFVRYLNQPDVAARNAQSIWIATPNRHAFQLADEEYQQDKTLFPDQSVIDRSYLYESVDADGQRIRLKMMQSLN
ncbi:spermidine/putrescine ABC transporter substrate-binding protein [Vibrio cholerae]